MKGYMISESLSPLELRSHMLYTFCDSYPIPQGKEV